MDHLGLVEGVWWADVPRQVEVRRHARVESRSG